MPKNPTYTELVSPKLPDELLISSLKNTQRKKSQVYNFSSGNGKKIRGNYFDSEEHGSEEQLLRPLIYALTGDISRHAIQRIQQLPFCEVFEKIGVEEVKKILEFVESRKRKFFKTKFNIPSSINQSMSFEQPKR